MARLVWMADARTRDGSWEGHLRMLVLGQEDTWLAHVQTHEGEAPQVVDMDAPPPNLQIPDPETAYRFLAETERKAIVRAQAWVDQFFVIAGERGAGADSPPRG